MLPRLAHNPLDHLPGQLVAGVEAQAGQGVVVAVLCAIVPELNNFAERKGQLLLCRLIPKDQGDQASLEFFLLELRLVLDIKHKVPAVSAGDAQQLEEVAGGGHSDAQNAILQVHVAALHRLLEVGADHSLVDELLQQSGGVAAVGQHARQLKLKCLGVLMKKDGRHGAEKVRLSVCLVSRIVIHDQGGRFWHEDNQHGNKAALRKLWGLLLKL